MKMFGKKNSINTAWSFSQNGNLWKFFFAGEYFIAGETRDTENKTAYLFTIRISDGNAVLKNHKFESGDFLNVLTDACKDNFYLTRLDKSGLPISSGVIAVNVITGEMRYEIKEADYLFNHDGILYCTKQNFETTDIISFNSTDGSRLKKYTGDECTEIYQLRNKYDEDYFNEAFNYPSKPGHSGLSDAEKEIIESECGFPFGDISFEYLIKNDYLLFNYYLKKRIDLKDISKTLYKNWFCIYNIIEKKRVFKTILNDETSFEVPDNFFVKNDIVYFIKNKNVLSVIKL